MELKDFYKTAGLQELLQAAAPLASMAYAHHDQQRMAQQQQEAAMMNELFRVAEHQRMQQTINGFKLASADERGDRLEAAYYGLQKEALGLGALASAGKALLPKLQQGFSALAPKLQQGMQATVPKLQQGARAVGQRFQSGLQAAKSVPAAGAVASTAAPAVTGATRQAATRQAARKPLIGLGTKLKVMGTAGLAGAGYAGYKGLQTARDYMMQPTQSGAFGRYGVSPQANVNQFGYAPY